MLVCPGREAVQTDLLAGLGVRRDLVSVAATGLLTRAFRVMIPVGAVHFRSTLWRKAQV